MRKGIKIKAFFIFMSWLMIFAHGIIPHSHCDDLPFHHEFHSKDCIEENRNVAINNIHDDKECRISNVLFHKFSQDDHQSVLTSGFVSYFFLTSGTVVYNNHYSFLSGRYSDTESLRAPPVA